MAGLRKYLRRLLAFSSTTPNERLAELNVRVRIITVLVVFLLHAFSAMVAPSGGTGRYAKAN